MQLAESSILKPHPPPVLLKYKGVANKIANKCRCGCQNSMWAGDRKLL